MIRRTATPFAPAATSYTSSVRADLTRFPELTDTARAALTDNVGAAVDMSHNIGPNGAEIISIARTAFVDSMSGALWVSAVAAIGATILALAYLPRDAKAHRTARSHGFAFEGPSESEPTGATEMQ